MKSISTMPISRSLKEKVVGWPRPPNRWVAQDKTRQTYLLNSGTGKRRTQSSTLLSWGCQILRIHKSFSRSSGTDITSPCQLEMHTCAILDLAPSWEGWSGKFLSSLQAFSLASSVSLIPFYNLAQECLPSFYSYSKVLHESVAQTWPWEEQLEGLSIQCCDHERAQG